MTRTPAPGPSSTTARSDAPPSAGGADRRPATTRRRLLAGTVGLAGLASLSGCLGPLQTYASRPIVLPSPTAEERGYVEVHRAEVPLAFDPVPFLGPLVEARSHVRVYATLGAAGLDGLEAVGGGANGTADGARADRPGSTVDGDALVPTGEGAATLVTFASPEAAVAGRPANPLSWTGVRDVVADLADSPIVTEAGVEGLTWRDAPRHVGSTSGQLLDRETAIESFVGTMTDEAGRSTRVAVHAASTTVDGTVALALGITGLASEGGAGDGSTDGESGASGGSTPTPADLTPADLDVEGFRAVCGRLTFDEGGA